MPRIFYYPTCAAHRTIPECFTGRSVIGLVRAYKEAAAIELSRQRDLSRTTRPQRDTMRAFGPKPARRKPPADAGVNAGSDPKPDV